MTQVVATSNLPLTLGLKLSLYGFNPCKNLELNTYFYGELISKYKFYVHKIVDACTASDWVWLLEKGFKPAFDITDADIELFELMCSIGYLKASRVLTPEQKSVYLKYVKNIGQHTAIKLGFLDRVELQKSNNITNLLLKRKYDEYEWQFVEKYSGFNPYQFAGSSPDLIKHILKYNLDPDVFHIHSRYFDQLDIKFKQNHLFQCLAEKNYAMAKKILPLVTVDDERFSKEEIEDFLNNALLSC